MTGRLLLRQAVGLVLVAWTVATVTFGLMHWIPGGPFDREKQLPPEILANVEAKYRLDEPLLRQYIRYLSGLLRGDLGPSYTYLGRTVQEIILEALPVSLALGALALFLSVALGLLLGLVAALRPGGCLDRAAMAAAAAGMALPTFLLGAMLMVGVGMGLGLLPPALWEGWTHAVLPALTLALGPAAYMARLIRSGLLEVLRQDFVRTARAKGLSTRRILLKHALRASIGPVVTYLGPLTAALVTGSFVVETLFSVPGLGRHFVSAVTNRDYPLILGVTLVYTLLVYVANAAVDWMYRILDPRTLAEDASS